jgi:crotonobetaine/carnitine-CoA ligase
VSASNLSPSERYVLPVILARHARDAPERTFVEEVTGHRVSYSDAHQRALLWAYALADRGAAPGRGVLVLAPNCIDTILIWFGIGWTGALEVPVHNAYRGRMLSYIVNDSRAEIILVAPAYLPALLAQAGDYEHLKTIVVLGDEPIDEQETGFEIVGEAEFLDVAPKRKFDEPKPADLASILYTSGTTGPSKGALVPWRQVFQTGNALNPTGDVTHDDVFYVTLPLFHLGGRALLALAVIVGAPTILRESFSTSNFWPDVERHGCTTTMLLGSMITFLVGQDPSPDDAARPLRNALCIPLPPDVDSFRERFGCRVHTWFGMTEVGIPIAVAEWATRNGGGCGRPLPGYTARVVDEDDEEVPPGTPGELILRGDEPGMLNAGYWGMPQRTVEAWRNLWFHTGDAVIKDEDGAFHFFDRWKDAIRRRGENISALEVEMEINRHPDVLESAVVAAKSEYSEDEVLAYVVVKEDRVLDAADLLKFLIPRMPYFMVPRYVEYVRDLPRTPTQKVRKTELSREITESMWDRETAGVVASRRPLSIAETRTSRP